MGGCPQSKVQVPVGASPGFTSGAPFSPSQQPLKYHSEPFEEERGLLACWSLPPPSSRGDGVGGFPLSSGEELPLELFLPGLQGAARVPPSPASVSEQLWVGGEKPSREVLRSRSHALRQSQGLVCASFQHSLPPFPRNCVCAMDGFPGQPRRPSRTWDVSQQFLGG